jgi:hypothetical protein
MWKEFVKRSRERAWEAKEREDEGQNREERRGYGELEYE